MRVKLQLVISHDEGHEETVTCLMLYWEKIIQGDASSC
jgi:hypothetical protein